MDIGVVICAYTDRRWDQIVRAVCSVEGQSVPCTLAIVIDHNADLLARAQQAWPSHIVAANARARGLSGARNTGVDLVGGDVIAFLDDDAHAHDDWLAALVAPFDDPSVGLTGGSVVADWTEPKPAWFPDEFLWVVGCSYAGLPTESAPIRNPIGASMAVRRAVFDKVGGFVDGIGRVGTVPLGCEETELSIRAAGAGFSARYEPTSVVSHQVSADRNSIRYFLRRCHAEGQSKAIVSQHVGSAPALSSERAYVTRTLPRAVARRCVRAVTGPQRAPALGGACAIVVGCASAAVGYARAMLRPAPALVHAELDGREPSAP